MLTREHRIAIMEDIERTEGELKRSQETVGGLETGNVKISRRQPDGTFHDITQEALESERRSVKVWQAAIDQLRAFLINNA